MMRGQPTDGHGAGKVFRSRRIAFALVPDEIRSIKKKYRELRIDIPGVALWEIDLKTGGFKPGSGFLEMLSFTPEAMPSRFRDLSPLFPPDDFENVRLRLNEHLLGHTPFFKIRHRLRTSDGLLIWCISVGSVTVRNRDGSPRRIIGSTCAATMYQRNLHRLNRILRALRHERRKARAAVQ
ncbi:MAG TPA: PAS domain-containing protein [Spirochaetota bacterium]|nr:PAS domain-containing protein [Spirochaetota bacterium]HPH02100.1 PAS domain-containing protein [Spirochaetota bacterium]HPN82890.1 PAS domain-containing protein [Spirochaetota bacterium]